MSDFPIDDTLMPGARRIVSVCAGVRSGEQVVIVSDTARPLSVITALLEAVRESGGIGSAIVTHPVPSGSEPPDAVRAAVHASDVTLAVTGKHVTQARVVGHVADTEILTVNAALGMRGDQVEGVWVTRPGVPRPDDCPVRPPRVPTGARAQSSTTT